MPGQHSTRHCPTSKEAARNATDNCYCIRTVATGKTEWECTWTTLLPGGHLTVEGPYYDDGTMLLHATGHPVGSEYDFIFTLTH